jgi:hypothetical protein
MAIHRSFHAGVGVGDDLVTVPLGQEASKDDVGVQLGDGKLKAERFNADELADVAAA